MLPRACSTHAPGSWSSGLDARAAKVLTRAHAAASPPAVLSAALSTDSPMARDDFFRHLFSDTSECRHGGEHVIRLRLELLPVLLQRSVVSVMAMHAHQVSGAVLRFCLERARAHVKDRVMMQMLSRVAVPGNECAWSSRHGANALGRRLADRLRLSRAALGHYAGASLHASSVAEADAAMVDTLLATDAGAGPELERGRRCYPDEARNGEAESVGDKRRRQEEEKDQKPDTEQEDDGSNESRMRSIVRKSSGSLGGSTKGAGPVARTPVASAEEVARGGAHTGALAPQDSRAGAGGGGGGGRGGGGGGGGGGGEARADADAGRAGLAPDDVAKVRALHTKLKTLRAHAADAHVPANLSSVLVIKPLEEVCVCVCVCGWVGVHEIV